MQPTAKILAPLALILAPLMAQAEVPRVVVDLPVVGSLVSQVMGDLGQPQVLLQPGSDAHEFQLRPSQAGAVAKAGLVIWTGPDLSPWLARALEANAQQARSVPLLAAPGVDLRPFNGVSDTIDPHVWFAPGNAGAWVRAIAQALAAADTANAATYRANATTAQAGIDATDARVREILAPVGDLPLIMFHDAFGYYAEAYGLNIVAAIRQGDAAGPGAERISAIRALLDQGYALCAFPEQGHDPAVLDTIAEGKDLRIGDALDPEAISLEPGPGLYHQLMTTTAITIAACAAP